MGYLMRLCLSAWSALVILAPVPAEAQTSPSPSRAATPLTAAEERALRPKDAFRECDVCPEMVVVSAGSFMMGSSPEEIEALAIEALAKDAAAPRSGLVQLNQAIDDKYKERREEFLRQTYRTEGPQHRVTIAQPFAVGRLEVTFAEWDACLAEGGCRHRPADRWGRGRQPVFRVSWQNVTNEYLPWLSRKTGKTYRLLSEAEWEYAARAGTTTRYAFGGAIGKGRANYSGVGAVAVGSLPPNAFGLHDMHGNVNEWVQDCWNRDYNGAPSDGSGWLTGDCNCRIVRGGSWGSEAAGVRSASRGKDCTNFFPVNAFGFRVARTLAP